MWGVGQEMDTERKPWHSPTVAKYDLLQTVAAPNSEELSQHIQSFAEFLFRTFFYSFEKINGCYFPSLNIEKGKRVEVCTGNNGSNSPGNFNWESRK